MFQKILSSCPSLLGATVLAISQTKYLHQTESDSLPASSASVTDLGEAMMIVPRCEVQLLPCKLPNEMGGALEATNQTQSSIIKRKPPGDTTQSASASAVASTPRPWARLAMAGPGKTIN